MTEEEYDEAFSDGYDTGKRYSVAYTKMLEERNKELKKLFRDIKLLNRKSDYPLIYGAIVMICNEALGESNDIRTIQRPAEPNRRNDTKS
jgi:hypothetical protein